MTNNIYPVMISAINSVCEALAADQQGLIEESRSYVAEIREDVLAQLPPDFAAVIDAAIADETNDDAAAVLLRRVVTIMGQEEEESGRLQNYLGGIRELMESGRYNDAVVTLSTAVGAGCQSALYAVEVAQVRANLLRTDNAFEDAQRARGRIESNARISHTMMVVRDMLDRSLNDSPPSSP